LPCGFAVLVVALAAATTNRVDNANPATVNSQNGSTSRRMCARPRLPHTQYLLRRKAGIDTTDTATTFDTPDRHSKTWSRKASMSWVSTTPIPDVAM